MYREESPTHDNADPDLQGWRERTSTPDDFLEPVEEDEEDAQ